MSPKIFLVLLFAACTTGQRITVLRSPGWVVVTDGVHSSKIGAEILERGGNAIDAAVAVSFALSVERPHSTGIGGGGFLTFRKQDGGKEFWNFRERAPGRSGRSMYLNASSENNSMNGPLAVAIPGLVAGLWEIHQLYGRLPWKDCVLPSSRLARQGIPLTPLVHEAIVEEIDAIKRDPGMVRVFLDDHHLPKKIGETILQLELSETLNSIAMSGKDFFYKGTFAESVEKNLKIRGGIVEKKDFRDYQVFHGAPLDFEFGDGFHAWTAPLPSSGGLVLAQLFKIGRFLLPWVGNEKRLLHQQIESLKLAYFDRAMGFGDDRFVKVPVKKLLSDSYAQTQASKIREGKIIKLPLPNASKNNPDSPSTSHFNIVDDLGNVVSSTQTINGWFGSKVMVGGVILNNEMDDFATKPGKPNMFGLIQSEKNSVAPGKTPLSSMSPTIVEKDGNFVLSVGTPGGSQIISTVYLLMHRILLEGMSPEAAMADSRYHHQTFPDEIVMEANPVKEKIFNDLGYRVKIAQIVTKASLIANQPGRGFVGVADPRGEGRAISGKAIFNR